MLVEEGQNLSQRLKEEFDGKMVPVRKEMEKVEKELEKSRTHMEFLQQVECGAQRRFRMCDETDETYSGRKTVAMRSERELKIAKEEYQDLEVQMVSLERELQALVNALEEGQDQMKQKRERDSTVDSSSTSDVLSRMASTNSSESTAITVPDWNASVVVCATCGRIICGSSPFEEPT
jgi:chromosome segregation ATPase